MKAMLLAAGRGERLRPLTDTVPKALVEAGGKPLIVWHLERLARAGIRDAVINISHLGERIVERLGDGARFGLRVHYSREGERLETAGGIANALELLGRAPFLLVNADVYCECDFVRLMNVQLGDRLAYLVLVPNPSHRSKGDFSLADGRLADAAAPRYTYAGVGVAWRRGICEAAVGERKIALRAMRRVGHEHEVRKPVAELDVHQPHEIAFAVHVGIHQQKRCAAQKLERIGDAARGLEALAFAGVVHAKPEARPVAQALDDALAQVRNIDDGVADPRTREALEMPDDKRLAASFDERLGHRIREWAQPLSAPGGQQHRLHASSSSSSRTSGASAV
jgi:MurNAc alpha-1-phosphate uridylyltransferase